MVARALAQHKAGIALILIIGVGAFIAASVVPLPTVVGYNVKVSVQQTEIAYILGTYYSITGVSGSTLSGSTLINWGGILSSSGPTPGAIYQLKVCVASICSSHYSVQLLPSIPIINGAPLQGSTDVTVGYVPSGQQSIQVTLIANGNSVATGSGSTCVGC